MRRIYRALGIACALSGGAAVGADGPPSNFGTDSVQPVVISAWEMEPGGATTTWTTQPNGYRSITGGNLTLVAVVHAPQGSLLTTLDLDACDGAASGDISAGLARLDSGIPTVLAEVQTSGIPGCGRFRMDFTTPEQVDNESYTYVAYVSSANTTGLSIGALRCYYKLQVSPAPPQATFNDVPASDPGFQYIEALVASGITSGCGSGNYCPNQPLTRRQMAVFFAKALGLHWYSPTPPN